MIALSTVEMESHRSYVTRSDYIRNSLEKEDWKGKKGREAIWN